MARRVTIVGAGVMGLSIAHELAVGRGGKGDGGEIDDHEIDAHEIDVTVVAERDGVESVSGVAAAIWFPYHSGESPSLPYWLARARERFEALAVDEPRAGVDLREGTVVEREAGADRWWTVAVTQWREAAPEELPAGAVAGVRALVPVITTHYYLTWLRRRCADLGVKFVEGTVTSIDEVARETGADTVVVAAGIGSGPLLGDDSMFPVRGQIVRLANPGIDTGAHLTDWITDDDHPDGVTYVVPRRDDIVCGGVFEVESWDTEISPDTEAAILRRVTSLVPELAGLPIVSRAAGLRPARKTLRLEHVPGYAVPVIACYGHGGAGVTLSWGCAEAVAELVREV
jgi:D-amino-acid oxidase